MRFIGPYLESSDPRSKEQTFTIALSKAELAEAIESAVENVFLLKNKNGFFSSAPSATRILGVRKDGRVAIKVKVRVWDKQDD